MQKVDPNIAIRAKSIYEADLREELEKSSMNRFVAIEPDSGHFYVGDTLSDAIAKARDQHPGQVVHAIRVGHRAAVHLGFAVT